MIKVNTYFVCDWEEKPTINPSGVLYLEPSNVMAIKLLYDGGRGFTRYYQVWLKAFTIDIVVDQKGFDDIITALRGPEPTCYHP